MPLALCAQRPSVLIVDDDPVVIRLLGAAIDEIASVRFVLDGESALKMIERDPPDLVLLDAQMPHMSGFEVCRRLKSSEAHRELPVIFVTADTDPDTETLCLELGAEDFISKPIRAPIVLARVRTQLRLKLAMDHLRKAATRDQLTGVPNRRMFDQSMQREWNAARRSGLPLSVLMIDIDAFKAFNDTFGHPRGDDCLARVAQALESGMRRPNDMVARYGGEEFVVILPDTGEDGAKQVAEGLRAAVAELAIPCVSQSGREFVSVSIGVATHRAPPVGMAGRKARAGAHTFECASAADLIRMADGALYAAKRGGRDRVECASKGRDADAESPGDISNPETD